MTCHRTHHTACTHGFRWTSMRSHLSLSKGNSCSLLCRAQQVWVALPRCPLGHVVTNVSVCRHVFALSPEMQPEMFKQIEAEFQARPLFAALVCLIGLQPPSLCERSHGERAKKGAELVVLFMSRTLPPGSTSFRPVLDPTSPMCSLDVGTPRWSPRLLHQSSPFSTLSPFKSSPSHCAALLV